VTITVQLQFSICDWQCTIVEAIASPIRIHSDWKIFSFW